ncbi:MAG TPA: fumarate hydratase [Candidatus Aquicultor sp.]|jgi:fumarate hydratase subunit alpha
MREVLAQVITDTVRDLCIKANIEIRPDVLAAIDKSLEYEESATGIDMLQKLVLNAEIAVCDNLPICQDTGYVTVFVDLGQDVAVSGNLTAAINEGVRRGYTEAYFRKSIVTKPLFERENTGDNTPAFINIDIVPGDSVKITVMPKGGGTENASRLEMLPVSGGVDAVRRFVLQAAENAAKSCPPVIVGVGIGGSFDKVGLLAKKALLRPLDAVNPDPQLAQLESELFAEVNKLGIGPGALGGTVTALGLKIETMATHIACLPCAVAFNCVATRQAEAII